VPFPQQSSFIAERLSRSCARAAIAIIWAILLSTLVGCGRLRPKPPTEYVYVIVKQAYLRDRVAAVSNRVALVTNGQQLEIVERQRRWVKVKTGKNELGWIEDRSVATAAIGAEFDKLRQEHAQDPVIATGSVRDELYMHVKPGRETDRFYLLPEGEKVQLLARAMAAKPGAALAQAAPSAVAGKIKQTGKAKPARYSGKRTMSDQNAPAITPDPSLPPQEDWWLVRDSKGHVGWLLSRRLDVDVPDAISGYSEGQKIVGAYVISTVQDTEAKRDDPTVPIYVVVLNAYKDGLLYDFDQIRVFTWSLKKHRYETAYRERGLQGYLPVTIARKNIGPDTAVPTFSLKIATGDVVRVDASSGSVRPGATVDRLYRMDGVIVRRVVPHEQTLQPLPAVKHAKSGSAGGSGKHRHHR
jgi:SH3-like domain-containing protein